MLTWTNQYAVVLDACVLAPMPLADTLLRMAEEPALYIPRWTDEILEEVHRTLLTKLHRTKEQADRRINVMREHFADALVEDYQALTAAMTNDPQDRHVLAAAVAAHADAILTLNVRHFPESALKPYSIELLTPDEFLIHQCHLDPDAVIDKIRHQASVLGRSVPLHLEKLQPCAPGFVGLVREFIGLEEG